MSKAGKSKNNISTLNFAIKSEINIKDEHLETFDENLYQNYELDPDSKNQNQKRSVSSIEMSESFEIKCNKSIKIKDEVKDLKEEFCAEDFKEEFEGKTEEFHDEIIGFHEEGIEKSSYERNVVDTNIGIENEQKIMAEYLDNSSPNSSKYGIGEPDDVMERNEEGNKIKDFESHKRNKIGLKFECSLCEYKTNVKHHLKSHLLVHSTVKLFKCYECDYECNRKESLKTHLLSHSNTKLFKCSECDYEGNDKGVFKRHLLTHSNINKSPTQTQATMASQRATPYSIPRRPRTRPRHTDIEMDDLIKDNILSSVEMYVKCDRGIADSVKFYISALYYTWAPSYVFLGKICNMNSTTNEPIKDAVPADDLVASQQKAEANLYIAGFAAAMHLAKEITTDNRSYIKARMVAVGHSSKNPLLQNLSDQQVDSMVNIPVLNLFATRIQLAGAATRLLEDVITFEPDDDKEIQKGIHAAAKLVLEGYGMTATTHMAYFISIITKALCFPIVREEAKAFKTSYKAFQAEYPTNWKLGRVLKLPGIENLDNSRYPHLYVCAMARARGLSAGAMNKYKVSSFGLLESAPRLERAALTDLILTPALIADI